MTQLKLPRWLQVIFYAVVGAFLVGSLIVGWERLPDFSWQLQPFFLVLGLGIYFAYLALRGVLWAWTIRQLDINLSYHSGVHVYLQSYLSRYLPGGIWPFMTIAARGQQMGLAGGTMTLVYIVNIIALLAINILFAIPLSTNFVVRVGFRIDIVLVVGAIGVLLAMPWILRRILPLLMRNPSDAAIATFTHPRTLLTLFATTILVVLCMTASNAFLIRGLANVTIDEMLYLAVSYNLAWTIGLIILFAPQGIGVREGIFAFVGSAVVPPTTAIALSLSMRLGNIIFDALLFGVLAWIDMRTSTSES